MSTDRLTCSARDIPPNAAGMRACVFGGVWARIEEKCDDGCVIMQYVSGQADSDADKFRDALASANGLFVVGPDVEVALVQPASDQV